MGNASALAGFLLLIGAVSASPARAQTATVDGAYQRLSPGNAKVAHALFDAQVPPSPATPRTAGTTGVTAPAPKPLTLDQIAAMKQGGQGWGQVFQTMKAQGLVQDRNLGQVVSRYQNQQRVMSGGVVTTVSNRAGDAADPGKNK
jgi:hypothetical protein